MKTFNAFRAWFSHRFPRLAYYYGSPAAWRWAGAWFAGALLWDLAERRIVPHWLWPTGAAWLIGGFLGIAAEAWHATTCPCVTAPEPFDQQPVDDATGGA